MNDTTMSLIAVLAAEELCRGGKVVIFTSSVSEVEHLSRVLASYNPGIVLGRTRGDTRMTLFSAFQKYDGPSLIIGTYAVMGSGVNLNSASLCVMPEDGLRSEVLLQAEGRFHRFGAERATMIWKVAENQK